jgi:RHS repeat-associated protein
VTTKDSGGNVKAQTTYTYDEGSVTTTSGTPQHIAVSGSRGNLTTVSALTSGAAALTKHFSYYDTGMLNTSTDVNAAVTTFKYGTGSCGNSFATEVDLALSLTRYSAWDCNGGVPTSQTDENNNATTYSYQNANFWWLTGVTSPDGGAVTYGYNFGTNSPWNITSSTKKDSSTSLTTETVLDGFGRNQDQQTTSDPNGIAHRVTTYDAVGHVGSVTNPYYTTSDQTYGVTQYAYDALDRVTTIIRPDNKTVQYTYAGRATMVQDEGSNSGGTTKITRVSQVDGLGRLTYVCEVSSAALMGSGGTPAGCGLDISATGFLTSYLYDALGNITSVSQPGVNPRTSTYDGLSRLTQEINPESGTTTYTYDGGTAGDLYQRTRPKQNQTGTATVTTTYTFDLLHRLTTNAYNDGTTPWSTYVYDETSQWGTVTNGKGRLTGAFNCPSGTSGPSCGVNFAPSVGEVFSYDPVGRVLKDQQCTPANCGSSAFVLNYGYDYLGDVSSLNNVGENNTTYSYTYDGAARPTKLQSTWTGGPSTLLTVNQYNALGEIKQATLGNSVVRTLQYDSRARVTSQTDASLYSFSLGPAADSNILTGNDSVNGNWTYGYDDFGRVSSASKTGQSFNWKYDPAGNRWQQNAPQGGPAPQYSFDANNHITGSGVVYDAAGNITNDGLGNTYTYDAEGRVLTVAGSNSASYVYDALGRRARATVNSQARDFIYDLDGRALAQMSGSTWQRGEVYAGGMHVATYANSTTYFDHADWLGTVRARSNTAGGSVETCTSLAFGDGLTCAGTEASPLHYAGQPLDSESNHTHFLYRQLSSTQGRWTTPDPAGLGAADPHNPQTWNRYTYVANNPLNSVDPMGLFNLPPCDGDPDCGGGGPGPICDPIEDPFCPPPPIIPPSGGGGDGGGGGGGPRPGGGGTSSVGRGGNHGPWPENQTTGLPQLPTNPLSLADLLGLNPGMQCDFVCGPISDFAPGTIALPLPRTVPWLSPIILILELTLMQVGDVSPCVHHPDAKGCTKSEDERCRQVREECQQKCWEDVHDMPVLPQDRPGLLRRCIRKCMNDQGCYDF